MKMDFLVCDTELMKTPNAQRKLNEARFFLRHLKEVNQQQIRPELEAFAHYLSAFLAAAISILYLLKGHEGGPTFKQWFRSWRENLPPKDRELLNFMWRQRDLEVHEFGAETEVSAEPVPADLVPGVHVFAPPDTQGGTVYVPKRFFKNKEEEVEVLEMCERYFPLLERLVREFNES